MRGIGSGQWTGKAPIGGGAPIGTTATTGM